MRLKRLGQHSGPMGLERERKMKHVWNLTIKGKWLRHSEDPYNPNWTSDDLLYSSKKKAVDKVARIAMIDCDIAKMEEVYEGVFKFTVDGETVAYLTSRSVL